MRGVDALERSVAVHEKQLVVPCEEGKKTQDAERVELSRPAQHPRAECLPVESDIAAEEEDKDVVHDPVVQAIEEKGAPERPLGQSVDVEIECCIEARPVVKGNLDGEDAHEQWERHAAQEDAPERHQEVEPDQNDHEVELILCIAEKEDARNGQNRRKSDPVVPCVVKKIKERPNEVGNDDSMRAAREKIPIGKWGGRRFSVEQTECRDKEKNRHGEARTDIKQSHEVDVW